MLEQIDYSLVDSGVFSPRNTSGNLFFFFLIRWEIEIMARMVMSANEQGERINDTKPRRINLYAVDTVWPQAGQPVCIHVCEPTLLFCSCHADTTICCLSKFCPAQQGSSHTYTHTHSHAHNSLCTACGQTARWRHTKWPTVGTHMLRPSQYTVVHR